MNMNEKREWRALQIAVSEIKKYNKNVEIKESSNRYYDLLVNQLERGLTFGVEIVRSEFSRTQGFSQYVGSLREHSGEIPVPIMLMSVNEAAEEVKIGLMFSWFRQRPIITHDILMRKSTYDNWNTILYILSISSQECPIQFLLQDKFYIKKTLSLSAQRGDGYIYDAELVYLRKLSAVYRMNARERNSQNEIFDFYLNGYSPDEYPSDSLDEAIYQAVNERIEIQLAYNQLIVMNTQLEDLQLYREYNRGQVHISVSPRIDNANELPSQMFRQFPAFNFDVDLYAYNEEDKNYFNDWTFSFLDRAEGWVTKVIEYRNALQNYRKLSEEIG